MVVLCTDAPACRSCEVDEWYSLKWKQIIGVNSSRGPWVHKWNARKTMTATLSLCDEWRDVVGLLSPCISSCVVSQYSQSYCGVDGLIYKTSTLVRLNLPLFALESTDTIGAPCIHRVLDQVSPRPTTLRTTIFYYLSHISVSLSVFNIQILCKQPTYIQCNPPNRIILLVSRIYQRYCAM